MVVIIVDSSGGDGKGGLRTGGWIGAGGAVGAVGEGFEGLGLGCVPVGGVGITISVALLPVLAIVVGGCGLAFGFCNDVAGGGCGIGVGVVDIVADDGAVVAKDDVESAGGGTELNRGGDCELNDGAGVGGIGG